MNAVQVADEIIGLFETHGNEAYAGEKVSQMEHMVQAAMLAEEEGYDEEVILAAFLHDIGHICAEAGTVQEMDGFGTMDHEALGAAYLKERGFSKRLVRLVESHVEAKRYLTFKYPDYYQQLSEASKKTLEFQGGVMLQEEAEAFEQYPLFALIIKMRNWDDRAKLEQAPIRNLEKYRQMIIHQLEK